MDIKWQQLGNKTFHSVTQKRHYDILTHHLSLSMPKCTGDDEIFTVLLIETPSDHWPHPLARFVRWNTIIFGIKQVYNYIITVMYF